MSACSEHKDRDVEFIGRRDYGITKTKRATQIGLLHLTIILTYPQMYHKSTVSLLFYSYLLVVYLQVLVMLYLVILVLE